MTCTLSYTKTCKAQRRLFTDTNKNHLRIDNAFVGDAKAVDGDGRRQQLVQHHAERLARDDGAALEQRIHPRSTGARQLHWQYHQFRSTIDAL